MPFLIPLAAWAAKFVGGIVGAHLFKNHFGGLGVGTLWSLIEGLGLRFFAGFMTAFYFLNPGVRSAVDGLFKALVKAIL